MNLGHLLNKAQPNVLVQAKWKLPNLGLSALSVCFTGISLTNFVSTKFAQQDIECPPRIRASIPRRQAEFLAGRLCVREQMRTHGVTNTMVGIGAMGAPLWPTGWNGSITHCRTHAASVLIPSGNIFGIGIDLELVADSTTSQALSMVAVSPNEDALFSSQNGLTLDGFRTLVFSAKESFFKASACHVGRYFDFTALQLVGADFGNGVLHFEVSEMLHPRLTLGTPHRVAFLLDENVVLTTSVLHR